MTNPILVRAVKAFGHDAQQDMVIEEASELIKAILKIRRKGPLRPDLLDNLYEEIADLELMVEQLKHIYSCHAQVEGWRKYKISKLKQDVSLKEEYDEEE